MPLAESMDTVQSELETQEPWLRGLLGGLAPSIVIASPVMAGPEASLRLTALVTGSFLFALAALLPTERRVLRRVIAILALGLVTGSLFDLLVEAPVSAYLGGAAVVGILGALFSAPPLAPARPLIIAARGALIPAAAAWFVAGPTAIVHSEVAHAAAAAAIFIPALLFTVGAATEPDAPRWRRLVVLGLMGVIAASTWAMWINPGAADALLTGGACAIFLQSSVLHSRRAAAGHERVYTAPSPLYHPAQMISVTFLAAIIVGTLLLTFPLAAGEGRHVSVIDAAFTATSAVCVTGLIVLDTPVDFSMFGQVSILLLIQVGGLGIMTLSAAATSLLGRPGSLEEEAVLGGVFGTSSYQETRKTVRGVILMTFATEIAGGLLLSTLFFLEGDPIPSALWRGFFTAVSAFCNAGFSLQSNNLVSYQSSPAILHTVAILIVAGGLGPVGMKALPRLLRRTPLEPFPALVIYTTGGLLLSSFLGVLAFEWNSSLASMSFVDRIHNAWFQAVTTRTAGFNSVDFTKIDPVTALFMEIYMFIGGSPGGTAGGIKTSTFSILMLATLAAMQGKSRVEVANRAITQGAIYRALAVTALGFCSALTAIAALLLTQRGDPFVFAFEVFSALGTVGLSTGGTVLLDDFGKLVIMATMFAGRVGPLTLFVLLQGLPSQARWKLPETDIAVG